MHACISDILPSVWHMAQQNIRFPEEILGELKRLAEERGVTVSAVIRDAVANELEREVFRQEIEKIEERLSAEMRSIRADLKRSNDAGQVSIAMISELVKLFLMCIQSPQDVDGANRAAKPRFQLYMQRVQAQYSGQLNNQLKGEGITQ